jgi:hypothetical protein
VCLDRPDWRQHLERPDLLPLWSGDGACGPPLALPAYVAAGVRRVRDARLATSWVAVDAPDLFRLSTRSGAARPWATSGAALRARLGVPAHTRVLAYLNATDDRLEGLFAMGADAAHVIAQAGVDLVGAPSYSVYLHRPRLDQVFAMRRMFTALADLEACGVPVFPTIFTAGTADIAAWADWLRSRPHVWVVGTILQMASRDFFDDIIRMLVGLQKALPSRPVPLHAVLYGVASPRRAARARALGLHHFTCVSSQAAMKALKGRRLVWDGAAVHVREDLATPRPALLADNVAVYERAFGSTPRDPGAYVARSAAE